MKPHQIKVDSLLQAREKCLEFITSIGIGSDNWVGGDVRNQAGKLVARVSYNGRLWEPTTGEGSIPLAPIVEYDLKSALLQLCYGATYQKVKVKLSELTHQTFRVADPLEAGKFMNVTFSQETGGGAVHAQFVSRTMCQDSLFAQVPACLDTRVLVAIS